jgi:hypothetical protein
MTFREITLLPSSGYMLHYCFKNSKISRNICFWKKVMSVYPYKYRHSVHLCCLASALIAMKSRIIVQHRESLQSTYRDFYVHRSVHRESMSVIVQQDATIYSSLYFSKLLYMFRVVNPPIIRITFNSNYSIWHWSNRLCYLPLSTTAEGSRDGLTVPNAVITVTCAPDDVVGITTRNVERAI